MAEVKFSQFTAGNEMQQGDIPVGLRPTSPTANFQFNFPGTGIKDSSGNYLFQYASVGALAVNNLKLVNSATGNPVLLTATGSDTNINLSIQPVGTGNLILNNLNWPISDGLSGYVMTTDGAGNLSLQVSAGDGTVNSATQYDLAYYATTGTAVSGLAKVNSAALVTTSGGVPTWAAMTDGQLIIGNTGGTPTAATLTAGTNISITNAGGSITIAATGMASFTWNVVSGTTQNMVSNNGYIANNAGLVTLNLPATSIIGDEIQVLGKGAGGWLIQCGGGQTIVLGAQTTSSGGTLASTNANDALYIVCTVANTEWHVGVAPQGNITYT